MCWSIPLACSLCVKDRSVWMEGSVHARVGKCASLLWQQRTKVPLLRRLWLLVRRINVYILDFFGLRRRGLMFPLAQVSRFSTPSQTKPPAAESAADAAQPSEAALIKRHMGSGASQLRREQDITLLLRNPTFWHRTVMEFISGDSVNRHVDESVYLWLRPGCLVSLQ